MDFQQVPEQHKVCEGLRFLIHGGHPARIFVHQHLVDQGIVLGQDLGLEVGPLVLDLAQLQVGVAGGLEVVLRRSLTYKS